jgi:hypothetical protein
MSVPFLFDPESDQRVKMRVFEEIDSGQETLRREFDLPGQWF